MITWNKKVRARMWAEMITGHIKAREQINFTKTITKYCLAISGIFLFSIWSLYFIFGV